MVSAARFLVLLAILSLIAGIFFKLLGLDLTSIVSLYPFKPQSFLNFSNTALLLAIALLLFPKNND
jgi:hypothetical protein